MKNGILVIFLTSFLLFYSACRKEIALQLPEQQQLVVLSNFTQDQALKLYLSSTIPLADSNFVFIDHKTVDFYEDGKFVEALSFKRGIGENLPYYYSTTSLQIGKEYGIQIALENYPKVMAQNTIPAIESIEEWSLLKSNVLTDVDYREEEIYQLKTKVQLPNTVEDDQFYHLVAWRMIKNLETFGGDSFRENLLIEPTTASFTSTAHEPSLLVNGASLSSTNRALEFNVEFTHYPNFELKTPLFLELRKVTKDYYLFHKTVSEQELNNFRDNLLLSNNVLIHNNIAGGVGSFSGYSTAIDSLLW